MFFSVVVTVQYCCLSSLLVLFLACCCPQYPGWKRDNTAGRFHPELPFSPTSHTAPGTIPALPAGPGTISSSKPLQYHGTSRKNDTMGRLRLRLADRRRLRLHDGSGLPVDRPAATPTRVGRARQDAGGAPKKPKPQQCRTKRVVPDPAVDDGAQEALWRFLRVRFGRSYGDVFRVDFHGREVQER